MPPSDFVITYQEMTDEQLLQIAGEGGLLDEANFALKNEMKHRNLKTSDATSHLAKQHRRKVEKSVEEKILPFSRGIGFSFYGRHYLTEADRNRDIQLRTKWFVVFYFPLIPIASYRFSCNGSTAGFLRWNAQQKLVDQVPLNWHQVLLTWMKACGILIVSLAAGFAAAMLKASR